MNHKHDKHKSTSWESVGNWYQTIVGEEGHYYHQHVILPRLLKFIDFKAYTSPALLDLACGPGVLGRQIASTIPYSGVDIAPTLIKAAKEQDSNPHHEYQLGDITKPLKIKGNDFSHATIILALQNVEFPLLAFHNAFKHLRNEGKLLIVLNHPCFRIPRQSSWRIDDSQKIQYRRIDRYFSPMKIPIQHNPSKGANSASTLSFHHPLCSYTKWLFEAGFLIEQIDEWCSNKISTGKMAKMENRSREEIPLFMCIVARKVT